MTRFQSTAVTSSSTLLLLSTLGDIQAARDVLLLEASNILAVIINAWAVARVFMTSAFLWECEITV